ncbi:MAG: hypothetical protein JWM37_286 [Candidatus Saccharibacteria bacterium]|nr:hypothetical protein [Candidatus Saccharibacteria bacterium]
MPPESTSNSRQKTMVIVGILALIVIATAIALYAKNKDEVGTVTENPAQTSTTTESQASGSTVEYKDGTYSATGNYQTPGGTESITVKLTVANNVVTTSDVTTSQTSQEAAEYQAQFKANYSPFVVGKDINDITLSRISGSSLTPRGFNEAVDAIKSQAQA